MSNVKFKAYENISKPFEDVRTPQSFRLVGEFTIAVAEGLDPASAIETLFAIGNRMGEDAKGKSWPETRRSMSVGDLVRVGRANYVCDGSGWSRSIIKHTLE